VEHIVQNLKNYGFKVTLLSIIIIKSHANVNRRLKRYALFNPTILSCVVKMKKPELRIYKLTLKMMKLAAKNCVFIDDREEDLIPAEKLGINNILFKFVKQLKKQIIRCGVNITSRPRARTE